MDTDLRRWMRLVEDEQPATMPVPARLYHGTSKTALKDIRHENTMRAGDHGDGYISFTTDWNVALRFAHWACQRDGDEDGVVLIVNGTKLNAVYPLESFQDYDLIAEESEWRVPENGIKPAVIDLVKRFIIKATAV